MNLCEKIRSKRLDLQWITSIFNENQKDRLGCKSVTFPHLDHPILIIDGWLGYQKASISFGKIMTSCFMNILHFLWREASQKMKVGKYENLGQFFMWTFKNWTAPDDPTKTADMLWYLARIIKSYFQDAWTSAYHDKYIFFTSLKFQ